MAKSRIAHPQDSHRSGRDRSLHRRWPVELAAVTADGPPRLAQITRDNMGRRTNLLFDCFAAIAASVMRSHLAEPEERRQNGQNTASTFDTAGRLLAHTHTIGGNPLDAVGYTLDANGWRAAIARPGGKDDAYTYDTTGQVLTASSANTAGPTTESFAYDLASNRTASTATPPDGAQAATPMTYAANALDQYTMLNGQAQSHDANGNTLLLRQPTQDDVTFEWDSENRMLAQERGGADPARIVNHYDALQRRVKKEIYEKPGGTFVLVNTHTFIYDGWNVIEERQFNAGGTLTALTRFTWGADLSGTMQGAGGVGGLLMAEEMDPADIDPPIAHYYWYDGNGNVTGITDDSGAIEGTFRYTSFGALAESATTTAFAIAQPWKFSTKYHDTEVEPVAGTYYYGFRHYLPSVGRWLSRDPIGERGGLSLYGMVGNNPVNGVDHLGLIEGNLDYKVKDESKYGYDYIFKGQPGELIAQDVSYDIKFQCDGKELARLQSGYNEVFTLSRFGSSIADRHQVTVKGTLKQVRNHVCGDAVGENCKQVTFSGTQTFSVRTTPKLNDPTRLLSPFSGFAYTSAPDSNVSGPGVIDHQPGDWPSSVKPKGIEAPGGIKSIGITHEFSGTVDPCKCTGKMTKHPSEDNYK